MQEEKKRTIVIASILKPVDDTRMYGKIAQTLSALPHTTVHVIGFPSAHQQDGSIIRHPLKKFGRISLARIKSRFTVLKICLTLRPDIFITTTHELLGVGLLLKILTRCRLVYDIQENYYRNILYTTTFPLLLRPLIALAVRLKEVVTSIFVDHFFLAERGYENELRFLPSRKTILENKIKRPDHDIVRKPVSEEETIQLLFSGTLAEITGVFTAIELAIKLHDHDARIRLHIIGYAAQTDVLIRIRNKINPCPFIELTGGDDLVPHDQIIQSIIQSDFGIIAYPPNPATEQSVPTKLYEYLGYRLPILLIDHPEWQAYCARSQAAIVFNPGHINAVAILQQMLSQRFYTSPVDDVFWNSEEMKLIDAISSESIR
jgi:glycosyltransferase involved in cell wall biosynthesis